MGCLGNNVEVEETKKYQYFEYEGEDKQIKDKRRFIEEKKERLKIIKEKIIKELEMGSKEKERVIKQIIEKCKKEGTFNEEIEEKFKKEERLIKEEEENAKKRIEEEMKKEELLLKQEEEILIKLEEEERIKKEKEERFKKEEEERLKIKKEERLKEEEERYKKVEERFKKEEERFKKDEERLKKMKEILRKEEERIFKKEEDESSRKEEAERLKKEEEERLRKEEEERLRKEEEERLKKEEEERLKKEEEERLKKEEEKLKKEEEERLKKEEEERLKKEEEERLKKEEEERLKKEEAEKIKRQEYSLEMKISEKLKVIEEKIKKYRSEEENKIKSEEEEAQIKKDEKEQRWKTYQKVGGEYRTKKEIKEYLLPLLNYKNEEDTYQKQPKIKVPYESGKLSQETNDIAIKMFNFARFAVGIPNNVEIDASYEKLAQDASLLMAVNDLMAHTGQPKPKNMKDDLYNSGAKGCASCNIYSGVRNIYDAVEGWIEDSGNFTTIGHRRWILHPPMKKTGFGKVNGYAAMYCFDNSFGKTEYKNIPWPCRNMPLEFGTSEYWTLSTGKKLPDDIEVTLTNNKTGSVEKFSNKTKDKFHISNANFGLIGCVIFIGPNNCKDGDSYRVDIKGTDVAVSYDVNFFNAVCKHEKEILDIIEPTCTEKGRKFLYCRKCDIKEEHEINMIPHKNKIINEILPTCTQKGKGTYKCETCFTVIEKELDIIPHNYILTLLSESTGESQGKCNACNKIINFKAPTRYKLWWKNSNSEESNYSSAIPDYNKINSFILCWIDDVNGDDDYREMVIEVSDSNLVEIPKRVEISPYNQLKLIGIGEVTIKIYPRYNPKIAKTNRIYITN